MRCCKLPDACLELLSKQLKPKLFKSLCDPSRLALLARLALSREPMTVTEASDCCGVHISGVSRHLALLRDAGVVRAQRRGREVVYQLDFDALIGALRGFADALEACRQSSGETAAVKEGPDE